MGASGSKTPRATTKQGRQAGAMFDDVELHVISLTYKDLAGLSKGDKRGEAIDKATFLQNFPVPGLVGDRLFHAIDSKNTGRISFDDFVVGLAVCCRGTLEEKMRFIFGVYDMDGDGFISRDELLLMLNQVPRTLLSIGNSNNASNGQDRNSPNIDWESLARGANGRNGHTRASPPHPTSRGRNENPSEARFFRAENGGNGGHPSNGSGGPPHLPPQGSSTAPRVGSRSVERKKTRDGGNGGSWSVGPTSAWTNDGIADQALKEFGSEEGKPLTFDQFQRWAQQTPAIQALLQGAFPSDAHFSLATSPRARRVSCESLSSFDSPRRNSSAFMFGTPTRTSGAAATAVAAVAGWSASASATRPPSRRGTLSRQGSSIGGENRQDSAGTGSVFFGGNEPVTGGGPSGGTSTTPAASSAMIATVAAPLAARTPSRTISRNTSYDNLLRTPLVGQGVVGPAVGSPAPSTRGLARDSRRDSTKGSDAKLGSASGKGVWKWSMGQDGVPKTPRALSSSSNGAGGVGEWGVGGGAGADSRLKKRPGVSATPSGSRSGVRMDKDADAAGVPFTTGRLRRKSSQCGPPPPASLLEGPSLALTLEPSPASSSRAREFHKRGGSSSSSSINVADEERSRPSPRPLSIECPSYSGGGGGGGSSNSNNSSAAAGGSSSAAFSSGRGPGAGPLKTPSSANSDRGGEAPTPTAILPGCSGDGRDVTRKARKLAMMALAAEEAERSGSGVPASCQDLLALANAAAASENPQSQAPRRGKLLRLLSQDGATDFRGGITPGRRKLMRLGSQEPVLEEGDPAAVRRSKKLSLRRANSLSAAHHARRKSGSGCIGGGSGRQSDGVVGGPPRREGNREVSGEALSLDVGEQAPASTLATLGSTHRDVASSSENAPEASPRARALGATSGSAQQYPGEDPANGDGAFTRGSRHGDTRSTPRASRRLSSELRVAESGTTGSSSNVSLGAPLAKVSPLLAANGGGFFGGQGEGGVNVTVGEAEETVSQATVGAEAVVRDCLYNSHGMVALDGFLWKPGSIRLVKRWMMLVDNTLYYFVRPGDRKPRGVISMPGCIAEPVAEDEEVACSESSSRKDTRKSRVPSGFFGLRLFRPNNHGKDAVSRLFLAKSAQERDEWVAELRVASRVVPLEDSFEIKSLLRKGAFASVHRCVRKDTGEEFAVKVIDKTSLSSHEKFLLRGEIGALKLVSHPNVVRLEAVHEDPRSISIVMTLCRGGDLWDKVRSQPSRCFTTSQARTVMRPLCEAVAYLHTLGILHRDIKPENILLVDNGSGNLSGVTLSDFGFSHQVSPKSRLACGKQLMGTPSYMAPESILHGMYGKEVDWFSCGCVLYMMLMGRAPFAGNNPSEIFRNTCHGRLGLGRGGASMWDKLPSAARELIVGLMQLDHNLRYTGEHAMKHRWLTESSDEDDAGESGRSQQQQQQQESGEAPGSKARTSSRRRDGDKASRASSGNGRRGSRSSSGTRRAVGSGDVGGGGSGANFRNGKLQNSRVRSSDMSITVE